MARTLTKKQQEFVAAYLIDGNATKAALSAGYSKRTAAKQGSQLLAIPRIQQEIAKKHNKRLEKFEISAEKVLNEIAKLAFFDPRKLFREDGSPKHITELDDETAMAVAGLDVNELYGEDGPIGQVKKYKLADKGQNLERLGRYLKLFTDKVEHSGKVTLEGLVCGDD